MSSVETESEVLEYILGLDSLCEGLGSKANEIYVTTLHMSVRPLLLRQRQAIRTRTPELVLSLETELVKAWQACLLRLQELWLVHGRGVEVAS